MIESTATQKTSNCKQVYEATEIMEVEEGGSNYVSSFSITQKTVFLRQEREVGIRDVRWLNYLRGLSSVESRWSFVGVGLYGILAMTTLLLEL
jgi:hypothetical protein